MFCKGLHGYVDFATDSLCKDSSIGVLQRFCRLQYPVIKGRQVQTIPLCNFKILPLYWSPWIERATLNPKSRQCVFGIRCKRQSKSVG